jgi:hypothetical protein
MTTVDDLLKRKESLRSVTLVDGTVVTVRGLSRNQVANCKLGLDVSDSESPEARTYELRLIAAGMKMPAMTEDQVRLWLDGDPDDEEDDGAPAYDGIEVMTAIMELSGMGKDARKSAVPGAGKRRRR